MFDFLTGLISQLIELVRLIISFITDGLPGGTPDCSEVPDVTCGTEEW